MTTIFSKIINREIPAEIIYEDDIVLGFLDINPVNKGHSLIIPKQPFVNIFDGDDEVLAHMIKVAKKVALALKATQLAAGVNLVMNNGTEANQEVFHAHIHVIPRYENDGAFIEPRHTKCSPEDFSEIKNLLVSHL